MRLLAYTVCWLVGTVYAQSSSTSWDVTTEQGIVRGYRSPDGGYFSFLGIPYATAPAQRDRFKAALSPPTWDGIFESTYENVKCPQPSYGEEQCLVINIVTPTVARTEQLPVLVHIHGGGFQTGSGYTSELSLLTKQGLIVVSFNYRIGVLGFLCLGTEEVPGNAGMKDQVAALRWIKRNIAAFGGDRDSVTLYGTSSGGTSVELLMLSESTKGLFHRAVSESGSALQPCAVDYDPIGTAKNLAEMMGLKNVDDLEYLTEFYQTTSANILAEASFTYRQNLTDSTFGFVPCVERPYEGAFLTESPIVILRSGNYEAVPYMVGYSDMEGFFRIPEYIDLDWKTKINKNFSQFLPADLTFSSGEEMLEVAETVKTAYFGDREISERNIQAYINYFGDVIFFYGILQSALLHARFHPVYLMEFAYEGGLNHDKKYFKSIGGAGHTDISAYLLRDGAALTDVTLRDRLTMTRMLQLWSNFAKFGDPTPIATLLLPTLWAPVAADTSHYLSLGADNATMRRSPNDDRVHFWDEIYRQYYRELLPVDPERSDTFRFTEDPENLSDFVIYCEALIEDDTEVNPEVLEDESQGTH